MSFINKFLNTEKNLYNTHTIHIQDVERPILWYNSSICVDAKPLYYTCYIERGILTVADITKDSGILYTYDEHMDKYRMQIKFMDYACLIDTIPKV